MRRSWVVQYRRAGATRRLLLGSAEVLSADRARAEAKEILAKVALGEDPQADKIARRHLRTHIAGGHRRLPRRQGQGRATEYLPRAGTVT